MATISTVATNGASTLFILMEKYEKNVQLKFLYFFNEITQIAHYRLDKKNAPSHWPN